MLREVIVVEGRNDRAAVLRALDAEVNTTGGFALNEATMMRIRTAYEKRGIIILTDPDYAGERIRKLLTRQFPAAGQAFIAQKDAERNGDTGVEWAKAETIRNSLAKAHTHTLTASPRFTMADIFAHDLAGAEKAAQKRRALGEALGIGYANAKTFLARLNNYGVTVADFAQALAVLEE
jgi:ribonuclease M5